MAIWNFTFSLLPRKSTLDEAGNLFKHLKEYDARLMDWDTFDIDDEDKNYWLDSDVSSISDSFKGLFPTLKPWSKTMTLYGKEGGTRVEVEPDSIFIKFDAREPDYTLLQEILHVANQYDCVLAIDENGSVVEPDFETVLGYFHSSKAYRFCENSEEVLDEIGKELR